jgi:hypothetical protein
VVRQGRGRLDVAPPMVDRPGVIPVLLAVGDRLVG